MLLRGVQWSLSPLSTALCWPARNLAGSNHAVVAADDAGLAVHGPPLLVQLAVPEERLINF